MHPNLPLGVLQQLLKFSGEAISGLERLFGRFLSGYRNDLKESLLSETTPGRLLSCLICHLSLSLWIESQLTGEGAEC